MTGVRDLGDAGTLLAVCVVSALRPDTGALGVTAIDKRAVDGPVRLVRYGAYADVQANRRHHGGLDKALYAYAQEDADFWAEELGAPLAPGWFGENLRISGLDVNASRIGERWRIGATAVVEVTMPRPRVTRRDPYRDARTPRNTRFQGVRRSVDRIRC